MSKVNILMFLIENNCDSPVDRVVIPFTNKLKSILIGEGCLGKGTWDD